MSELEIICTAELDFFAVQPSHDRLRNQDGTGGIGKTWLALTWAHRNLHRFTAGGATHVVLDGNLCAPRLRRRRLLLLRLH